MNLSLIRQHAKLMDIILKGDESLLEKAIGYAQSCQTVDGAPSLWGHSMLFIDKDTIAECTIDFRPYKATGKRLDNGPQWNDIQVLEKASRGLLLHFPWTDQDRRELFHYCSGLIDAGQCYSIFGLVGSLISFWLFPSERNPLASRHSIYCSSFIQQVYSLKNIDFDPKRSLKNTSPEKIAQFEMPGLQKIRVD